MLELPYHVPPHEAEKSDVHEPVVLHHSHSYVPVSCASVELAQSLQLLMDAPAQRAMVSQNAARVAACSRWMPVHSTGEVRRAAAAAMVVNQYVAGRR